MKFSKQALLGTTVLLGGSVLLYATMHQVLNAPAKPAANSQQVIAKPSTDKQSAISNEPLTADIATEKNLLAQKQKEREQRVAAQEQQAQQYMTEQQRIEAEALARSRAENQLYANKNAANTNSVVASSVTAITQPVVKPRPVDTVAAPPQTQAAVPNTAQTQSAAKTQNTTQIVATPKPTVTAPAVAQPQPVARATPNNSGAYQVKAGEGLIGLSRRYNVPVDVLASVNNLNTTSSLRVGQTITIPTAAQVNRITQQAQAREQQRQNEIARKKQEAEQKKQQALLQQQQEVARKKQEAAQKEQQKQQEIARKKQEAQLKEQKRQQEIAQKKLEAQQQAQKKQAFQAAQDNLRQARQTVKQTDVKGTFGVQVALATDQKKASEIIQKLQAAGYKVKTTQTSKGIRIVVGPEKGKVAALALKDKLNNDSRVDVNSGWVLYW
ncbi:LysM peptidoglycan-binding domain-containing protein [Leucothrix sargassi]|nr:LysM peptidoglycan-binding domain-containing protein [Leucothrix sargassi]